MCTTFQLQFLYENIINELESIYIELVAKDTSSDTNEPFVIFSSCIDYRSVNESYTKENVSSITLCVIMCYNGFTFPENNLQWSALWRPPNKGHQHGGNRRDSGKEED